jgi:hypothetical protein
MIHGSAASGIRAASFGPSGCIFPLGWVFGFWGSSGRCGSDDLLRLPLIVLYCIWACRGYLNICFGIEHHYRELCPAVLSALLTNTCLSGASKFLRVHNSNDKITLMIAAVLGLDPLG